METPIKFRSIAVVLATLPLASLAQAQNSVTLYGELDDGIAYYNNVGQHSLVEMQGADLTANKWGLKGNEDLGGGNKAIFTLENGFNINNGKLSQGGREFGKKAFVGLANSRLGTITLGRQLDSTVDLVQPLTADVYGPAFTTPGDADNNDNSFRLQNAVKYESPLLAGFQFEVMYGLGGVAGSLASQSSSSAALSYKQGGFSVAAGYVFARNDGPGGASTADETQNSAVTPLYGSTAFVGSRMIVHAAAQYERGGLTANIRYSNAQWKPYGTYAAFNRTETFNTAAASLGYFITPATEVNVGYTFTKSSGASSATYNNVAAGFQYLLSKRTTLYTVAAYSHASGTTFSQDGESIVPAGGTVGDLASSSSTPSQVVLIFGVTTKF
ncbi:porin [Trinickia dinghuensis]|uniref:Porin n=1 Tax=Trinickia dinghuensis TaxID=2291023 RepID=A0A3D8JYV1_9BURK|nr:porin [Trinickia dinghuensis]RDU98189.1 porin [Trinickia dinghuensis]